MCGACNTNRATLVGRVLVTSLVFSFFSSTALLDLPFVTSLAESRHLVTLRGKRGFPKVVVVQCLFRRQPLVGVAR